VAEVAGGEGLRHSALFYRGQADYVSAALGFIGEALDRKEPVFAAVPGAKVGLLRSALAADAERVVLGDMAQIGRNPARIIPAVRAFADLHPGERVCYFGEPTWPARTGSELREAARHEALINLAFAGVPVTILCPYDMNGSPAGTLTDAERTHPLLLSQGRSRRSSGYLGPDGLPPCCEQPLAHPPPWAQRRHYLSDLRTVRDLVTSHAARAGLAWERVPDLVLAVSEVAANTLRHTTAGGTVQVWHTGEDIMCQIDDTGRIADPLAGRVRPAEDRLRGHGLWLVNQICDLVEVRTGAIGTTIRLSMSLRG
jgi:anti-sigma regulatory factor (Ser/Thr protein kinase)